MTIKFPDLSHFRPGVPVAGLAALITKATQGTTFVDATYTGYRDAAQAAGIPFAGYHYITTGDPAAQARHAFSVIGRFVPAMWDFEDGSGTLPNLLAVHDAYTALGGRATLAYVPRWYWAKIGHPDLRPLTARGLALISSRYTDYSDTGPGWDPYGGVTPDIWQYTNNGTVAGHAGIDMNAFRGSVPELARLFAGTTNPGDGEIAMPLTDADLDAIAERIAAKPINVRPAGEQTDAGVTVGWALRQAYYRSGYLANTVAPALLGDETAAATALAALKTAVDGLPAAIAALPGAGPGGTLTETDVEQAVGAVLARTTATLDVAPPTTGSGS